MKGRMVDGGKKKYSTIDREDDVYTNAELESVFFTATMN